WADGRIFIANSSEGTLLALEFNGSVEDLDYREGPVQYFPLRIEVGPHPEELIASSDEAYILVFDPLAADLRVVDTATMLQVRDSSGEPLRYLFDADALPGAMIALPNQGDESITRVAVGLAGERALAIIRMELDTSGALSFILEDTIDVGAEVSQLALHPAGDFLYFSDSLSAEVVALNLLDSTLARFAAGGMVGPLTVSGDGEYLVAGRFLADDVVIFSGAASGALELVDANAVFTPLSSCLESCDASTPTCEGAHGADQAICGTGEGLQTVAPYKGVYLGIAPSKMVAMGEGAANLPIKLNCDDETEAWSEYIAVAGLSGEVRFVGLKQEAADEVTPSLLDLSFCEENTLLAPDDSEITPLILGECPLLPEGRERFACMRSDEDDFEVAYYVGRVGWELDFLLDWEGVVLDRDPGAGILTSTGGLRDENVDYDDYDIKIGDLLEIRTSPFTSDECRTALGGSFDSCKLERKITEIQGGEETSQLMLAEALPSECFRDDQTLSYVIRAAGVFLIYSEGSYPERLLPGEVYGPGGAAGARAPVLFATNDFDSHSDATAC
ncbi:hypothetical protein KAI87_16185, partial [Myxococcota bacterium]|nr:hypothetical protein [Myxococcota bacterium]